MKKFYEKLVTSNNNSGTWISTATTDANDASGLVATVTSSIPLDQTIYNVI